MYRILRIFLFFLLLPNIFLGLTFKDGKKTDNAEVVEKAKIQHDASNDLIVFFSNVSYKFNFVQDLDGNLKLSKDSIERLYKSKGLQLEFCFLRNDDYDYVNEHIREIINLKIPSFFEQLQLDNFTKPKWSDCNYDGKSNDILIIQNKFLDEDGYKDFIKVGLITQADVNNYIDQINNKIIDNKNRMAELENKYINLAKENNYEYLGSFNFEYWENSGFYNLRLCTLEVSGDPAIPFLIYPVINDSEVFSENFQQYINNYDLNIVTNPLYAETYTSLSDLFEIWQEYPRTCDTFVGYPSDIIRFIEGAKRVNEEFFYEFNELKSNVDLFNYWANKNGGYLSWVDYQFAKEIQGDLETLKLLKEYKITNIDEYKETSSLISTQGYLPPPSGGELHGINSIISFLDDQNYGLNINKTALEVKLEREEALRIKAEKDRLEQEKILEEERKAREKYELEMAEKNKEKIKNGNGYFTYFDDGSCTNGEETVCVTKDQFLEICNKVSGWYNTGFSTIFGSVGLFDNVISELEKNMGEYAFSDVYTDVIGGKCMFNFRASGTVDANYYDRNYSCPVWTIKGEDGWFGTYSIDSMFCSF